MIFFLGLDLARGYVVNASRQKLYEKYRNRGTNVYFVIYDLLPVTMPQFFSPKNSQGHDDWLNATTQSNGVICISKTIADDYRQWLSNNTYQTDPEFNIYSFSLDADTESSLPSFGFNDNANLVLEQIKKRPSFLQVGAIEPHKGNAQAISAFNLLWEKVVDVNLVLVGKQGWMVEERIDNIQSHPEFNKRLFWLDGISDEYLEKVYVASTCLIASSEGEGFGLPLIEAAQHKLPIIARDISVFREVASENAFYFSGLEPSSLANKVIEWLNLYKYR